MQASAVNNAGIQREQVREAKTAPEGIAVLMDILRSRMSTMESIGGAFNKLYDALTPEQKAIVDKYGVFAVPNVRDGQCKPGARKKVGESG